MQRGSEPVYTRDLEWVGQSEDDAHLRILTLWTGRKGGKAEWWSVWPDLRGR